VKERAVARTNGLDGTAWDKDDGHPEAVRLGVDALSSRLRYLAAAHPSSPEYQDLRAHSRNVDGQPGVVHADGEHLTAEKADDRSAQSTPADRADRPTDLTAIVADARRAGLATDRLHTIDDRRTVWSAERADLHDQIIDDLYAKAGSVPCEGKALLAGGLPGSGKSTVLASQAGIDRSHFLTLDPDEAKVEMAHRGMIPEVGDLSPMEASDLVHEESSHITKQLALRAYAESKNVIWDITMSSSASTQRRISDLRAAGYGEVEGIFVDIPIEASVRRAGSRYREGQEAYVDGRGVGGRYVAPEAIRAHADPEFGSTNRRAFEDVKSALDRWRRYDNSIDGDPAELVEEGKPSHDIVREEDR
jgi:Zeta toxin